MIKPLKPPRRAAVAVPLLAAALLALSGCGESPPQTAEPAGQAPEPAKPPPEQKEDKLSLHWMIAIPSSGPSLPTGGKDFIKKAIEDKFKVDIKLDYMPMGDMYTSKLNELLASDNAPDLFHADGSKSYGYIVDGDAADLSYYVTPQNMPNYFKWVTQDELRRYQVHHTFKRAPVPFSKAYYGAYYVRKDWIDALNRKDPALNLKVPTNYDEMIAVMKAFTFGDPDGNGKNDTYGYTTTGSGMAIPNDMPQWFKNGLTPGFFIDEVNRFVDSGTNKRTAKVLDDIRDMMNMKIIDPDWFKNKAGENISKVQQGKVGIFFSNVRDIAFDHSNGSVQKKMREMTGGENVAFEAFHIAGDIPVAYAPLPGIPFLIGAKTSEAKARRTIEILDYLASPEGWLLANVGKENVHYKKEGNRITLIPEAIQKDIVANGHFTEVWGSAFSYKVKDPSPIGLELVDPRETEHDRAILRLFKSLKLYELGTNVAPPPGLDIGAYRKEMRAMHVKTLFEDQNSAKWPVYMAELLEAHKGKAIFETYAQQMTNALGRKITFSPD
ncbi:extracellular solute-binding protein [Paenibacillus sp. GYB003]|uniref:extracellular solute-binding protein n=1 Tax=Paenibacillus sp. GYB003 TaxID=2994392 RepID=UPI002F966FDF